MNRLSLDGAGPGRFSPVCWADAAELRSPALVVEPQALRRVRKPRVERRQPGDLGGIAELAQRLDLDRRRVLGELASARGLAGVALHGHERGAGVAAAQRGHREVEDLDLVR